jgi:hypothetical protein
MKYFLFALTCLSIYACSVANNDKQLEAITNLNVSLDSIEKVMLANEIDTIAALRVATNGVELRIKNYYYSDTIDMALGKKMDAYKVMRRSLGPLSRSYSTVREGISVERSTLKNLKTDIEKGKGEKNKYQEYVDFEKGKVNQLRKILAEYVKEKNKTMETFHELHNELYDFSIEVMNKNMNQPKPKP